MFQEADVQKIHIVARALAQGPRASNALEGVLNAVQQPGVTNQANNPTDEREKELARSIKLLQPDN